MASSYKNPPTMRSGLSYDDWKKELKIWQRATTLDAKQQGAVLLLSLEGRPRETVLAEVKEEAYDKDDIVTVIIACLDGLLKKEKSETQYGAFDEFIKDLKVKALKSLFKTLIYVTLKLSTWRCHCPMVF